MKVTYNSPNRSHHYPYAEALREAGVLHAFVSGYSRFGRDPSSESLAGKLRRVDYLQTLYVMSLRYRMPHTLSERLAWTSKCRLDAASYLFARDSDLFLFYSGAGLKTLQKLKKEHASTLCVVEAVNTHARYQERILREEHERLGLDFSAFPKYEMSRRCMEYEQADAIVCPSSAVKRSFITEGISEEKIWVVPYGFPAPTASNSREDQTQADGEFTVLYVGSLSVRKGVRYLIEGFQALKHPRKRLVLVGPKSDPSGIDDLCLGADIEFPGVLKGDDLEARYRKANVFVQPSLEEGLSLVLGEALAHGIPIIATRESGVEELFADGTCGYHIESRSAPAITKHLASLAESPVDQELLGRCALRQAELLGGWKESGRNLVTALTGIFENQRPKSHKLTVAD